MAVDYAIPSWISQPPSPSPAASYITSLHQGAQIGLEQQQLQQRAVLAQQELNARQQEQAQRMQLEQQQIEYDHALKTAELGMQQQKLDEAKQLTDLQIAESARRFSAQQAVQADIDSGVDPATAMFRRAADLGMHAGDIGALSRAVHPPPGLTGGMEEIGDGYRAIQTGPNTRKIIAPPKAPFSGELTQGTVNGEVVPGVLFGPKGQEIIQRPKTADPGVVAKLRTIDAQRRELRARLSNKAQFESEVETIMRDFHSKDRKWATDYAKNNLAQRIADLDKAYDALAGQSGAATAAGPRKLRVLSVTPAGQGAISAPDEALTPPSHEEEGDEDQ